ncbi:MAG: PAS domain S-box protein [Bacteroidota bacterium]
MIAIEIIYNLSILVAFSVVSDLINRYIAANKLSGKIAQGMIFGIVAIIAMLNPFVLSEGLIFDGRSVVLSLCALFFGPLAGVISGVMAIIVRIIIGGDGVFVGVPVIISSVAIGVLFRYFLKRKAIENPSVFFLYFFGIVVHIAMLLIFLALPQEVRAKTFQTIAITVIIFYPFATVLIGVIIQNQLSHHELLSKIENQNESLSITLNSIGDGVISVDLNSNVVHLNKVAEILCGIIESKAKAKPVYSIFNLSSNDKGDITQTTLNLVLKSGEPKVIYDNIRLLSLDKKEYYVSCNISPIKNRSEEIVGAVIAFSDVSLQHRLRESLGQSESMFRAVFESSASSIVIINLDGYIIKANEAFYKLFGYSQQDLLGENKKYQDITYVDDLEESSLKFYKLINGEMLNASIEKRFITKEKNIIWGIVTSAVVNNNEGKPLFIVSQIVDISERKKSEIDLVERNAELSLLMNELSIAKEKAEKSDMLKTAFLANMSHEIRTPMNGIIGVADLLVEPHLNVDERNQFVAIMHSSCSRLLNTINDILDAAKIESHQIEIVDIEFSLISLFDHLRQIYTPQFEKKQLLFSIDISPTVDLNSLYLGDYNKIIQILTNLLNNSLKFTEKGHVALYCKSDDNFCQFVVEDTGVGISDEFKNFVFSNFSQEDVSMNRGYEGSGLGLVIAKGLAHRLNGSLEFTSIKNTGTKFILSIPLKRAVDSALFHQNFKFKTDSFELIFLVAEDDDVSFYLIEKILIREFSAKIIRAKNGIEALNLFIENRNINMILMDIKMPLIDGFECVQRIRVTNQEIPIIAVTAYAFDSDRQRAIEVGCNDYLSKPFNWNLLLEKIKSFVG